MDRYGYPMRHQICVTLDENTLLKIREKLRHVKYRSKSHFVEIAVEEYLKRGDISEQR